MLKIEKEAFLKCKQYILDEKKERAIFWLDRIISYWHTPKEFTKTPYEILTIIKSLLSIDSEIMNNFKEELKKLI